MDEIDNIQTQGYICGCRHSYVPKHLIKAHLKLPHNHKISKVTATEPNRDVYKQYILKQIDQIYAIIAQIQISSARLIKAITENTIRTIQSLETLCFSYKDLLRNQNSIIPHTINQIKLVSAFKTDPTLTKALQDHFQQEALAREWVIREQTNNANNKILNIFNNHCGDFHCLAVSNNEKFIVTGGIEGAIRVWDCEKGSQICCFNNHKDTVWSVALGYRNNLILSGSADCSVRLWSLQDQRQEFKFKGHSNFVTSVLVSNDEQFGYSGSCDFTIKIWNLGRKVIRSSVDVNYRIFQIFLISSEKYLVAVGKGGITFRNLDIGSSTKLDLNDISAIKFTIDGIKFITGHFEGQINIWETFKTRPTSSFKPHSSRINQIEISTNSQTFISCSNDKTIQIWDLKNITILNSLSTNSPILNMCLMAKSYSIAYISSPSQISIMELRTYENSIKIAPKPISQEQICVTSDLVYLAYSSKHLSLFDLTKYKKVAKIPQFKDKCTLLVFSYNSQLLVCGNDEGEIYILMVPGLLMIHNFHLFPNKISCLAISAENTLIGCGYEDKVIIFSIDENQIVYQDLGIKSKAAAFCLENKKFVYSEFPSTIYVVSKYFYKVGKICLDELVNRIVFSENKAYVAVGDIFNNWACFNIFTYEKIFEYKKRKGFVKWSKEEGERKFKVFARLRGIIYC